MDFIRSTMEIGIFETLACVDRAKSEGVSRQASNYLPRVSREEACARTRRIAGALSEMGASQLLLLCPELALLEELAELGFAGRVYVCLARELDRQSKLRISENVPVGLAVSFIDEGEFPTRFLPSTSAVVAFGFGTPETAFLPGFQHRQIEYYRCFTGPVLLACVAPPDQGERPLGWHAGTTPEAFTAIVY